MKLRQYLSAAVLLGAVLTLGARAASPYQSYNHTEWVSDVPAPDAYEGANEYFRMAVRRESESVSFEGVRKNFLRRNTPVIVVVLALLLTAVILLTSKKFRRWLQERPRRKKGGDAS